MTPSSAVIAVVNITCIIPQLRSCSAGMSRLSHALPARAWGLRPVTCYYAPGGKPLPLLSEIITGPPSAPRPPAAAELELPVPAAASGLNLRLALTAFASTVTAVRALLWDVDVGWYSTPSALAGLHSSLKACSKHSRSCAAAPHAPAHSPYAAVPGCVPGQLGASQ
ncbi:hypothetical protein COO60DRAFT_527307 [Scenedesmus sp. NREL 46B-D3]|nr:hypothetical protein COO60DRAFT_527307 [Scenedesmus sp. NREL 46B-D3]